MAMEVCRAGVHAAGERTVRIPALALSEHELGL